MHEVLDRDFNAEESDVPVGATNESAPPSPLVLRMPLPEMEEPADSDDPTADMADRFTAWEQEFKRVAERFLLQQGYSDAKVVDIESLRYTEGYDKDDYILTIRTGTTGETKIGEEGVTTVPIIVRRVPKEGL